MSERLTASADIDATDLSRAHIIASAEGYAVHVGCGSEAVADSSAWDRWILNVNPERRLLTI